MPSTIGCMFKLLALITLLASGFAPKPELLAKPVPFFDQSIINPYRAPLWEKGPGHRGIDLVVTEDAPITAPFDGRVFFVGKVVDRKVITLISDSGLKASFEPVCSNLVKNQRVFQGYELGFYCEPDPSYEKHCVTCIHFSIRNQHGYLNPELFYGLLKPPRLLG